MRAGVGHSKGVAEGGRDENAVVPVFPESNDGNFDGGTRELHVRKPLDPDRRGATDYGRCRHLAGRPGIPHGLAGVSLAGNDEPGTECFEVLGREDQGTSLTENEFRRTNNGGAVAEGGPDYRNGSQWSQQFLT